MKITELKTKWWYRLLKVIYYFFYIISLIFGIIVFPIVIIVFELLRGTFFYILTGNWNFQIKEKKKKIKNIFTNILNYIKGDKNSIGITRIMFNLLFVLLLIPGYLISIRYVDINIMIGLLGIIGVTLFYIIMSFYRFHNIGKSGWNSLYFIIPFYNIYLLYLLVFKKGIKDIDEKIKKEKLWNILVVFVIVGVFMSLRYIRDIALETNQDSKSNIETKLDICKKMELPYFDISDKYIENTLTLFYDTKNGKCFLLREFNSHGGNGLIKTYLYDLETKKEIQTINNQVSDEVYFSTSNDVYINRLDDLLSNIIISKDRVMKIITIEEIKNDIISDNINNYDKIFKLRNDLNYHNKKNQLYIEEEEIKNEMFILLHYRILGTKHSLISEDIKSKKQSYSNYINPKFSFEIFKSWYKDVSNIDVLNIKKIEKNKYSFTLKLLDNKNGNSEYKVILKLKILDNGIRKIETYESKIVE